MRILLLLKLCVCGVLYEARCSTISTVTRQGPYTSNKYSDGYNVG